MSLLFLEGPSHAPPHCMRGRPHFHLIDWPGVSRLGATVCLPRRWEPRRVSKGEDLGGSLSQDRGHTGVCVTGCLQQWWMVLQFALYGTNVRCHNTEPELLPPFITHISVQLHVFLPLLLLNVCSLLLSVCQC